MENGREDDSAFQIYMVFDNRANNFAIGQKEKMRMHKKETVKKIIIMTEKRSNAIREKKIAQNTRIYINTDAHFESQSNQIERIIPFLITVFGLTFMHVSAFCLRSIESLSRARYMNYVMCVLSVYMHTHARVYIHFVSHTQHLSVQFNRERGREKERE